MEQVLPPNRPTGLFITDSSKLTYFIVTFHDKFHLNGLIGVPRNSSR